jgi:hypothetical protein
MQAEAERIDYGKEVRSHTYYELDLLREAVGRTGRIYYAASHPVGPLVVPYFNYNNNN